MHWSLISLFLHLIHRSLSLNLLLRLFLWPLCWRSGGLDRKCEASPSVKPTLVSMLNAKILFFWLDNDCASHSVQMIESVALEREPQGSQKTSMILSSVSCKKKTRMIYCHSFATCSLWEYFFNHSREKAQCPCLPRGCTEKISKVIPVIKVIFPLCLFYFAPCSPHSLSPYLVLSTKKIRKKPPNKTFILHKYLYSPPCHIICLAL